MTTSLSNTALSYWLMKFSCYKNGIQFGKEASAKLEGDDNISGWSKQLHMVLCKDVINQLGFDVTVEHEGTMEGAMFCKTLFAIE